MTLFTTGNLLAVTVQAGGLVLAGAPLPRLLGLRAPRARLAYCRALLLACLLLPALQPYQPLPAPSAPPLVSQTEQVEAVRAAGSGVTAAAPARWVPPVTLMQIVAGGILVRAVWLLFGLAALRRLRRRATRLDPRPVSVQEAVALAGVDAEFRVAHSRTRPLTFGIARPVVIVPSDFAAFSHEEQKAIACHELTHVRRRDWLRNAGDEVVRALAWFHPAAWWLTRQIRLFREEVVDQEVVAQTGQRRPYLDALLRLSAPERGGRLVPAPLFLGRSHLSVRVALLLKEVRMSRPRLVSSFVAMAAALVLCGKGLVAAVPLHGIAGDEPVAQAAGAPRPGQVTPAPRARSSKALRLVHAPQPVFAPGAENVPVIVALDLDPTGAVVEATGIAGPSELQATAVSAVRAWRFDPPGQAQRILVGFNPAADSGGLSDQPPVLVGGKVKAPRKTYDVKPVYPADAAAAGAQGIVILETVIAPDGAVSRVSVLRSAPLLDAAALDAVLRWRFTAPGFPVQMVVTVNFALDDGSGKAGAPGKVPSPDASPAAAAPATGALRVGGAIAPPAKTYDVKAVYPEAARSAGVQGVVLIDVTIAPDGKVSDARVLRSIPLLDQAALDAVRQWEFTPTLRNGQAVAVSMTVTVNFVLE